MKKTGTSMSGSIEYVNSVKPIDAYCYICFHAKKRAGTVYCSYYDLINPNKKKCARFYHVKGKNLDPEKAKKKKKRNKKK